MVRLVGDRGSTIGLHLHYLDELEATGQLIPSTMKANIREEVRQELEAEFARKLKRMKNDLEKEYMAKQAEAHAELEARYKALYESREQPGKRKQPVKRKRAGKHKRTVLHSSSEENEAGDADDGCRDAHVTENDTADLDDDDSLHNAPTTDNFASATDAERATASAEAAFGEDGSDSSCIEPLGSPSDSFDIEALAYLLDEPILSNEPPPRLYPG